MLGEGLRVWGDLIRGKLALVRMDNGAAAHANYGAGRLSALNRVARCIKERGITLCCTAVDLRIPRRDSVVADALSRFTSEATGEGGEGAYPDRELSGRFR